MVPKLVSILTPCFNSTGFIAQLLESVLQQDYPCIEHILIDDGSTDGLPDFLERGAWFQRFSEKGFKLYYHYQVNQGQAVAINAGLQLYNGSYVTWPDSDDYYRTATAISTFVKTMEIQSVDIVRCYPLVVNEHGEGRPLEYGAKKSDAHVFYDCLLESDFWFSPICYFFTAQSLQDILGNKILESRVGQNFQLFLPLFYYGKLYTLSEQLVAYLVRTDSHSHRSRTSQQTIKRLDDILNLKYTLLDKYNLQVDRKVIRLLQKKKDAAAIHALVNSRQFRQAIDYISNRAYFPMHAVKIWLKYIF
ncbi:glycosyltransferase family 2 protein [Sphingobacterium sp. SYP-B4668]|uniref:glycosyltransferase family 2 protein n=1 Tax=Sphingobacterium sp. SYP-B4668 TaxID=2996035 RepID=UPI0022DDB5EB|nr:glycosyltransferase [Sphingobacterium sp. SYP-B4668]